MLINKAHLSSIIATLPDDALMLVKFERDIGMKFDDFPNVGEPVNVIMHVRAPYSPAWHGGENPAAPALVDSRVALPAERAALTCSCGHGEYDEYEREEYDDHDDTRALRGAPGRPPSLWREENLRVFPLAKPIELAPGDAISVTFEVHP